MPEQFQHTLDNGLVLLGERLEGVRSLALGFTVGAGAAHDPTSALGLGHLTESMLLEGTASRSSREITDTLDGLGVRYGTSLDSETASLSGVMVGAILEPALAVLADVLRNPSFPDQELEQTRASILQELRHEEDEPMQQVRNVLRKRYYKGHPYSKRPTGEPESVAAITGEQLREQHAHYYGPRNTTMAVAGDFDWDAVRRYAERELGGWEGGRKAPTIPSPEPEAEVYVEHRPTQQEHIAAAGPSVQYGHRDYYAAIIAAEILGGGMSSRLFEEVREKRGLVYSVGCSYVPGRYQGSWRLYAGTTPERAPQTYEVLLGEVAKIDADGITEEEFARFQGLTRSHVLMSGESTSARLRSLLSAWWYEGRMKTLASVRERIDETTLEQVDGVLRSHPIGGNLTVCALGPATQESLTGSAVAV